MGCESRQEVHTLKEEHKRRHKQTCTLRHSCTDAIVNVLPHARTAVSGESSDKNVASVPHSGQGRESYMIGASMAACRS